MSSKRVVVVGGGVIGTACAYYLAKVGWEVTLVDRHWQGRGCSDGNCGLLAFSHVLPLNEPGAVWKTLKAVCRGGAPLYVKLRFDPRLWWWMLRFARSCNRDTMMAAARARADLLRSSEHLYNQLFETEQIDCEWQRRGCLFVYQSAGEMEKHAKTAGLLRETFDVPVSRYDGEAVLELEPALKPGIAGAWLYEADAHLRPETLLSGWRLVLENMGVTVLEQCTMTGFVGAGQKAQAVATDNGEIAADAVVVACGAETALLSRQLGCRIPIQPGKGYSITMPRPDVCPEIPIILQEHKVAVTPWQSGYRLGSTMEFSGFDRSLNRRRLNLLVDGARIYLREPHSEAVEDEWYGWRPMTFDGKPILGPTPAMHNVFVAAGHSMLGTTMAPATGKLVAEMVDGRPPHIDPTPFAVTRWAAAAT
jgi:D-amino-acid dehydrogenase